MTEHTKYFELDMTEPEDATGAQRPPRDIGARLRFLRFGPTWRRRGAIAAALVVGLALGAIGVDKERDDAADRASRGAVSLAAALVGLGPTAPSGGQDVIVLLRLYNAGHEPVEVVQAAVIGSAYLAPHGGAIDPTVAKPRQWTALTAVAGRPDCDTVAVGLRALGPPILQVTARTVNGRERTVGVPLVDPYDLLSSARDHQCPGPAAGAGSAAGFRIHYPAVVDRRGRPTAAKRDVDPAGLGQGGVAASNTESVGDR
jgi:hypothetical protein